MAYEAIGGFPPQKVSNRENWLGKCRHLKLDIGECTDPHRRYSNHVFIVYMHVNKTNGHVYVGITHHVNPNKRWGYSGQKYTHCIKFIHAIKKYGWDNFDHIILCRTTKERAIVIERALIAHYKRLGISYNLGEGGEGSQSFSEETRAKLRSIKSANPAMRGRHHTPEAKAKISEANRKRVYTEKQKEQIRKAGELGRAKMKSKDWHYPEESRRKMAKSLSIPVLQLDLNGNIIREFASTAEADKFINNGKKCNHIADVCNGKRKTASGYIWRYKERRII